MVTALWIILGLAACLALSCAIGRWLWIRDGKP